MMRGEDSSTQDRPKQTSPSIESENSNKPKPTLDKASEGMPAIVNGSEPTAASGERNEPNTGATPPDVDDLKSITPNLGDDASGEHQDQAQDADGDDVEVATEEENGGEEDEEEEEEEEEDEEDQEEEDDEDDDEDEEDDDDEEDEEPRLKYVRLTQNLGSVYRNGDATSACLVAGDKMIMGTHNGNIHVLQLPSLKSLRVYHAHSASVTSISISPYPPPLPSAQVSHLSRDPEASPSTSKNAREQQNLPRIPSNDIYIATSSMDGNVCVQSLLDMKDVHLRSFGRPVQSVALSPDYKSDRTYISGGLAGQLVLTTGGGLGRSTSTTTGTAAATAAGWLGSVGLGGNAGKDTVLHSGEGTINCIKWSLSGKFIMWLNEHGIKIMRSKLHLDSASADFAWKRIGHIDRPQTEEWETMASVWKGRAEWIDEGTLESNDMPLESDKASSSLPATKSKKDEVERLLVGWGSTIWIVHVHGGEKSVRNVAAKTAGSAEIVKILRMDCIISGISLYTKNLLLVLAFCSPEEDDDNEIADEAPQAVGILQKQPSTNFQSAEPSGGIRRRQNNLAPELRLIDLDTQEEVDKDSLTVSRYERLFAADYHLGLLPARNAASVIASKGALEALTGLGSEVWNAAINPKALFSSGASILSRDSGDDAASSKIASTSGTIRGTASRISPLSIRESLSKPGAKIFIQSPYDCILATKRDLADHLRWLVERKDYSAAWEVLDENPEIWTAPIEKQLTHSRSTSSQQGTKLEDFFDDESAADSIARNSQSTNEKEKRNIGELWIQQLIEQGNWKLAGDVCGKVLKTADRWEKWVWAFASAKRFDEIVVYIPSQPMTPPLPTTVYEVVLGHYIQTDKLRLQELMTLWPMDLYDTKAVAKALENQLKFRDVREDSIDDGEIGRDWKIVIESLAKLYEAGGRHREALKYYIKLHDADSAFRLIRDNHLAEAVADDIPAFISLRVPPGQSDSMIGPELAEATSEAIQLLVEEAQHGLVPPKVVVEQLEAKKMPVYLFFYLRALWRGDGLEQLDISNFNDRVLQESRTSVDEFADLAIHLFAAYERPLLMEMLKSSTAYTFEKAVQECEQYEYYDELVYLYSKTGQMKRALHLIIDRLHDVQKAIEFAKEQDDPDLWEVLLSYSMDKPNFIRALLERVGTTINPIKLVRRIPAGLEIQGLREGLVHMMKEHELQYSISSGAARVLRSEVAATQNTLRNGQRRGIKFNPVVIPDRGAAVSRGDAANVISSAIKETTQTANEKIQTGSCAQCKEPFTEYEMETLLGYTCGHVFHISHLLQLLHHGKEFDVDIGGETGVGNRYLVGMKVMKARLLRDKVRGGCPLCHSKDTCVQ